MILFLACVNYSECLPQRSSLMEPGCSVNGELSTSNSCSSCLSPSFSVTALNFWFFFKYKKQICLLLFTRASEATSHGYWSWNICVFKPFLLLLYTIQNKISFGDDLIGITALGFELGDPHGNIVHGDKEWGSHGQGPQLETLICVMNY